ncbi:MAG TPA: inositol monophosphatase [Acidimicrobiales bacterium]|jgi:fructose-1,6-bisphosphatase/inositol monophosphatase family enzyme|nr:inositol monophosphatase [Acidimicrobiales bacterium]
MVADKVLEVLHNVASAVRRELDALEDWGLTPGHEGQYRHDVVADEVALGLLDDAGYGVLSEESGLHNGARDLVVVIDPVDGSTNASRGLPWWATSLCAVDSDGPLAAVVANQSSGVRYAAVRGAGATCDGQPIAPSECRELGEAVVAFSGYPTTYLGWGQYRSLGAAALDMCAVASGNIDAFVDCPADPLAPWDYLGALLVCQEAGAHVADLSGRDLVVRTLGPRRTPVAAATRELLGAVLDAGNQLV